MNFQKNKNIIATNPDNLITVYTFVIRNESIIKKENRTMKKMTLALSLFAGMTALSTNLHAQAAGVPYNYSYTTVPYTYLDNNATTVLASDGWDDTTVVLNLPAGFDFKYQGVPVTQWRMDTYGGLYPNELDLGLEAPFITGIQSDYVDNGNSKISLAVSGTAGSRIAKVEFRNVGFYDGTATDTANFQIWLYEGSSKIEYHTGPSNVQAGFLDPFTGLNYVVVGLLFDVNINDSVMVQAVNYKGGANTDTTLVVDPTNPDDSQFLTMLYDTAYPVNGAVFAFTPQPVTSVKNLVARISAVSPNPASDKVTLQLKNTPPADAEVSVYTLTGQKVLSRKVTGVNTEIALNTLSNGVYMLSYHAGGQNETLRIVKK